MTRQEAYVQIRAYFSKKGARLAKKGRDSGEIGDRCLYRTTSGRKCAVGCLISDELYDALRDQSDFDLEEQGTIDDVLYEMTVRLDDGENGNLKTLYELFGSDEQLHNFLTEAQRCHDVESSDAKDFVMKLDLLAKSSGLEVAT